MKIYTMKKIFNLKVGTILISIKNFLFYLKSVTVLESGTKAVC